MTKFGLVCILINLLAIFQIQADVKPNKLIILSEHLPPYQIGDSDKLVGGTIGLKVKGIIEKHYPDAVIHVMPWARAYKLALERPNTLIFSIVRTPAREKLFHWIAKVDTVTTKLIANSSSGIAPVSSLAELKGYQIGVKRYDAVSYLFLKYGFAYGDDLIEIVNTLSTMKMLEKKRVDIIPSNDRIIDFYCKNNACNRNDFNVVYTFTELSEDFYIAASLGTEPETLQQLIEYFKEI